MPPEGELHGKQAAAGDKRLSFAPAEQKIRSYMCRFPTTGRASSVPGGGGKGKVRPGRSRYRQQHAWHAQRCDHAFGPTSRRAPHVPGVLVLSSCAKSAAAKSASTDRADARGWVDAGAGPRPDRTDAGRCQRRQPRSRWRSAQAAAPAVREPPSTQGPISCLGQGTERTSLGLRGCAPMGARCYGPLGR